MKISEVPQDEIKTMQGVKKALYAVDDQGNYTRAATRGWEAEEIVLHPGHRRLRGKGRAGRLPGENTTKPPRSSTS